MVEKMDHTTPRLIKSSLIQRRSCLDSGVMHRSANLLLIILFWHVFVFVFVSSESYSGTTTSDTRNHFNQKLIFSNNSTGNLHPSDSEVIHESDSYFARHGKKQKYSFLQNQQYSAQRKAKCKFRKFYQTCNEDLSKILGEGRWHWIQDFIATFGVNDRPIYMALGS